MKILKNLYKSMDRMNHLIVKGNLKGVAKEQLYQILLRNQFTNDTMTIEELLNKLEPSIRFLVSRVRPVGMQREDLAQELRLQVVKEYQRYKSRKIGWWFIRLKWALFNKLREISKSKEPLNNSISLDEFPWSESYNGNETKSM